MKKITSEKLPDMQQSKDGFPKIAIEKVGVRGNILPLNIKTRDGNILNVVANISSYCSLDKDTKGINMSRIARTLHKVVDEEASKDGFSDLIRFTEELNRAHGVDDIFVKTRFEYLYATTSPMTDIKSYEPVDVTLETIMKDGEVKNFLTVETVEMSLCPCSKEMSLLVNNITDDERQSLEVIKNNDIKLYEKITKAGFGAHNQKSMIKTTVELNLDNILWIEDIVEIAQRAASSPTFSILKRPDEKWVTEVSYMGGYYDDSREFNETGGGPAFVEDISRGVADQLDLLVDKRIHDYVVVVNNQESIHSGGIVATSILTAGRELQ